MDETTFIDLQNNKITNSPEGYIHCDKLIAEAILELNNKGYKTNASCQGHSQRMTISSRLTVEREEGVPLEQQFQKILLACYQQGMIVIINGVDEEGIHLENLSTGESVYISFQEEYEFDTLPEGFIFSNHGGKSSLLKYIDRRRPDNTYKTGSEMYEEIQEANRVLVEWAKKLEPRKGKTM